MIDSVFNYTGGKFKLLNQLLPLFDYSKLNFIDLFTGGGSVYINVLDKYDKILINDVLYHLIELHKQLANDPITIIDKTKGLLTWDKKDKEAYLKLRQSYNEEKSPEKFWALMLTCTNNMIRFNNKLEFNQSHGERTWNSNTYIKVEDFVNHVHKYKDKIFYASENFYKIKVSEPSMVYLDPPYMETLAGYNRYWSAELDERLFHYIIDLDKNGHSFAFSGVLGEHRDGRRSKLVDRLINLGYHYHIINHDYQQVARNKNITNSQEVLITSY